MQNLAKVEDHVELRKDRESGAILLSDHNMLNEYKSKKAMMNNVRDVSAEINSIKQKLSDLESVKTDMQEIKELLRGLAK
jgi:uncharacterized protein YydD (DUF2326 family)